jgi:7-keto-8-aminopelargonate synthetase-like enzyme
MGNYDSPCIPVLVYYVDLVIKIEQTLHEKGFYILAVGYPFIDMGLARIRIILTVEHNKDDIDGLVKAL